MPSIKLDNPLRLPSHPPIKLTFTTLFWIISKVISLEQTPVGE